MEGQLTVRRMITPRLELELYDELHELARVRRRTLNETVKILLERGLEDERGSRDGPFPRHRHTEDSA